MKKNRVGIWWPHFWTPPKKKGQNPHVFSMVAKSRFSPLNYTVLKEAFFLKILGVF